MNHLVKHFTNTPDDPHKAKVPEDVHTIGELQEHIEEAYERKRKRPLMEQTHKRCTFLIDRKLDQRLNALCAERDRGFKTLILNRSIEAILREYN